MKTAGAGEWLEKALQELCKRMETGLDLDSDLISGLVSFCELAPPEDAKEYLNNIIGQEAGQSVIEEYLQLRGYTDNSSASVSNSKSQTYVKPPPDQGSSSGTKKQTRSTKDVPVSHNQENKAPAQTTENRNNKANPGTSKKKKSGKAISLAEAAKGTIIFQQGKPCSCQARRHRLVSNCLSCGKIVCEQEGEGPCSFCGALVLKEGSTYAGLDETVIPLSESEATAEAFAKRLVDYDRNAAARTTVIDDQSDYYEIDSNSWLSKEWVKSQKDKKLVRILPPPSSIKALGHLGSASSQSSKNEGLEGFKVTFAGVSMESVGCHGTSREDCEESSTIWLWRRVCKAKDSCCVMLPITGIQISNQGELFEVFSLSVAEIGALVQTIHWNFSMTHLKDDASFQ